MNPGRRTGTLTALAGALALTALTAPQAQAASTGVTVSNVVVNKGLPIVVGTSEVKEPPVTFDLTLPTGYTVEGGPDWSADPFLYHGTTVTAGADSGGIYLGGYTCFEAGSAHKAHCEGELYIEPRYRLDSNGDATTWKIGLSIRLFKASGSLKAQEYRTAPGSVAVRRWAKLTANAAPEPVAKGRMLTVTGGLTRADWVKHTYTGFAGQSVKLQFRPKGSSTYSTVKSVTSSATGALRTTVTANADGYWRWVFGGTSTTGSATATGDYVDVS
ncbi:hypothetical protein ACFV06_12235 [Streptomyces sp. NPDC059618]|uniref:hypothetical protein n=1 Tax=Streptomyces sp. NPDC059618 TaxID=3346887 RepID=UPI0036A9C383